MASCNWAKEAYFSDLMCADRRAHTALELFVDDLHADKDKTIYTFLCHSGSEDFLWGLVRLLGSDNPRVAGNSAYIIGTLAESDLGCGRIMVLAKGRHSESRRILGDLTNMLTFNDAESVMNAAGTMGTLAESQEGRAWMLTEPCMNDTIQHITALLSNENLWTASNAALVLARLCISEDGCNAILAHPMAQSILSRLVQALGVDEAGRGMNAAFAIGRLCDMDTGRQRLLGLHNSEKMISSLVKMLSCEDPGASKNACFALSCLATNLEGHSRLLQNVHSDDVLKTLAQLLSAQDSETGWFAAMTLRTLASQPRGCLRLRDNNHIICALKVTEAQNNVNPDLKEEVIITLEILKRLDRAAPPQVEVKGPDHISIKWNALTTKSGFTIKYQLYEGTKCIYDDTVCEFEAEGLQANKRYSYKVRAYTEGDMTSFSEVVTVTTEEDLPGPVSNLHVLGCTISQLKIGWEPPEVPNGVIKGYYVYQGRNMVEHTSDLSAIITGLTAHTPYEVQVCAATAKGKGERSTVTGTTAELGAHAPSKPHVQVIGRNEMHISWEPPEVPLGRITRYDLSMNGKGIYSGMELSFAAHRLTPDTEYTFLVTALTNEGRFESKATKKRTAKDGYDASRPPLYQPPAKKEAEEDVKQASGKKRKSLTEGHKLSRTPSGSGKGARNLSDGERPKSASSGSGSHPQQRTSPTEQGSEEGEEGKQSPPQTVTAAQKARSSPKGSGASNVRRDSGRPATHKESSTRTAPSTAKDTSSAQHRPHRADRTSHVKAAFPVTVSYVSIQGGDNAHFELDTLGSDLVHKKALIRTPTLLESPGRGGIRFDRSKTSFLNPKPFTRPRLTRLDNDFGMNMGAGHQNGCSSSSSHPLSQSFPQSLSQDGMGGFGVGGGGMGSNFPKPAMPSQSYLEGLRGVSASSDHFARSPHNHPSPSLTPRSCDGGFGPELTPELLPYPRLKRTSTSPTLTVTPDIPVVTPDSSYYVEEQQAFVQRTHTFMRSHRPAAVRQTKVQYTNVPIQLMGNGGRAGTVHMGEGLNQHQRPQNKFVPMQLRTQPSNLTPGQLQRVNTTILEPRGSPARRLESLPRSHTQANLKSQHAAHVKRPTFYSPDLDLIGFTSQSMSAGHS
ncbi:uncharacterized protein [Littorina saxatilis]|uniref:uncharacterized protein n=1 Tax=Littorina saxatilis TaxID=31220 RepID=UPI0038B618E1